MAKKENYYITIKGRKYDRKLIQLAEEFTSGKRDGKISINDAKRLLKIVKDNNAYTDIEKHTIEYIRENYKFTEKSDEWFRSEIRKWAAKKVQEAKKKSDVESILVDDSEAPEINFPSSWGEDKTEVVEITQTSTIGWRENSNFSSTTSHSKKNKKIIPTLIFLSGFLILVGLVYFFRTLFYKEDLEQVVKTNSEIVSNSKEKQSDVSIEKAESTKEVRKKNVRSKKEESEIPKNALTILKPQTGKKLESKSLFSSLTNQNSTEEFSSNPQFREIESNVIRFEKNSIQIHKESRPSLNRLARWMKQDSSIRVKVIGHTSLEGSEDANQKVSLLRAQTVRNYIAGNGISKDRFEIIPKGASVPIGDNSKEEGKEMNRRVELRIYN
ncbi:OmpA family protein [Leptospira interrogans str. 2003000735]|uniref:OmpA family protein n=1 Tax=Leptospira interrogans str. 2002000626 TaxID=996803 RepID=A0A829CSB4_LEPIR|nr:OmpA family protein [Leptospira interrogans]EMY02504.1 OmpA family protein [Leptospira interrogans str. 2002000626]EKN87940.1 OmpA family protein [Leptospira interrogans str. 2002000624]EKQ39509.1 OmpA family protein [Leptospira interrogans str. 2002000621]EKQ49416.1 OmpA family protein [Leptospira interrogans str. 2002000623]EKR19691.1 OmpA family protein [Leptospira interrogans serovar Pyrogenes str. 2006006960]